MGFGRNPLGIIALDLVKGTFIMAGTFHGIPSDVVLALCLQSLAEARSLVPQTPMPAHPCHTCTGAHTQTQASVQLHIWTTALDPVPEEP